MYEQEIQYDAAFLRHAIHERGTAMGRHTMKAGSTSALPALAEPSLEPTGDTEDTHGRNSCME